MQFTHTWRIIESTDLRDFPPRQPRTDFHQYHTDAPLEKSSALHIPANFLADVLFDQLRKVWVVLCVAQRCGNKMLTNPLFSH